MDYSGSPWHSRPYRLGLALASLSETTFMGGNPLALHVKRVSPVLPDSPWAVLFADDFKGGKRRDQRGFMSIILAVDSG